MDSTRIKIGQVLYGQSEGSGDIALVKVESVGVGGINYNDTDNTFQYSFDELTGIPVSASVLTSSGFTLSNGVYVNDTINFIKVKLIGAQWFWYANADTCIPVPYLHELQSLYKELTGNTLAVDEDALLIALDSPMVLSAPTDFAVSDTTPTTVTISWLEDVDAEWYEYQIDDGEWVKVLEAEAEITGRTHSTTYKIRVKAIGDDENFVDSPESEEYSFTTAALIVLDAPADLTATDVGVNEITITWGEVANATEYEVQIGETTDTTDQLTYQFTSLDADTGYNISVKAVGDDVTYDDSALSAISETTDPLIVLEAPADLTTSEVGVNEITITWGEVANATEYEVQIRETTYTTEHLTYQFTSLDADTEYNISVKAVGDGITYDDSLESEVTVTTDPLIVLDAPANLTATEVGENYVTVTWSAVANASEYEVSDGETTDTVTAETLTYQFTSLDVNTGYTFSVKAVGDGVTYGDSLESEVTATTLKQKLDTPVVTGTTLGTTSVKFSWNEVANSVGYICQYKEGEGSFVDYVGEIANDEGVRSVTLTELTPGTPYTISVKAIAAAESNYRDSDSGSGTVSTNAA